MISKRSPITKSVRTQLCRSRKPSPLRRPPKISSTVSPNCSRKIVRFLAAWPSSRSSVVARAAVDVDGLAGDEAAVVADQKEAGGGDLVHMPLTAQWNPGGARHPPLIPFGIVPPGVDAAGGDHVGADVLGGELG